MKKNKLAILAAAAAFILSAVPVSAAVTPSANAMTGTYVYCETDDLTANYVNTLDAAAAKVSDAYGCGVYVAMVEDFTSAGYSDVMEYSQDFFEAQNYGLGSEKTGIMLLLSMRDRDYQILAHGSNAHYAFTDYGKDQLAEVFLDDFRNNDWMGGFTDFINECDYMLRMAAEGNPIDVPQREPTPIGKLIGGSVLLSAIFSFFTSKMKVSGMKSRMKSAIMQTRASQYIGEAVITAKDDVFITRNVTRVPIQKSSSSGGGGTTVNSSGYSGKSGKF